MEITRRTTPRSRILVRALILVLVVVALAGAAVLFAPRMRADTSPAPMAYTAGSAPYVSSASAAFKPGPVAVSSAAGAAAGAAAGYHDAGASPIRPAGNATGYRDAGASAPSAASNGNGSGYLDAGASVPRVARSGNGNGYRDAGASAPRAVNSARVAGYLDAGASAVRAPSLVLRMPSDVSGGWADSGASLPQAQAGNTGWQDAGAMRPASSVRR